MKNRYTEEPGIRDLIHAARIPRAEDLPYMSSPPIQFVYESYTDVIFGDYTWNDAPTPLIPDRPILPNALYYFRNITLAADIESLDFTTNIAVTPRFYMFRLSDSKAVLFREPIVMNMFYQQFDYRLFWSSHRVDDQLLAAFRGSIEQGSGLIGKFTITLKAVISAQEIVDEEYINLFKTRYPGGVA